MTSGPFLSPRKGAPNGKKMQVQESHREVTDFHAVRFRTRIVFERIASFAYSCVNKPPASATVWCGTCLRQEHVSVCGGLHGDFVAGFCAMPCANCARRRGSPSRQ